MREEKKRKRELEERRQEEEEEERRKRSSAVSKKEKAPEAVAAAKTERNDERSVVAEAEAPALGDEVPAREVGTRWRLCTRVDFSNTACCTVVAVLVRVAHRETLEPTALEVVPLLRV